MVADSADTIRFAIQIARNGCEISVEFGARFGINERGAIFGAENDMEGDEAE